MAMFERFRDNIKSKRLIDKGDTVVLGVSGGPDSLCMLSMLARLAGEWELTLLPVHVNHMLRGDDSEADMDYVSEYCRTNGLECTVFKIDVALKAREWNMSLEEAGRKIRYDILRDVAKERDAGKIAIGQNKNDQAETILMRMMRGTGLKGLAGIEHKREDLFIRPILIFNRLEIEDYCMENKLTPRIDLTNLKPIYTRNKIRLELIPYIMENFNEKIVDALFRMGEILRSDNDFIEECAEREFANVASLEKEGQVRIDIAGFNEMHNSIKTRIIRKALERVKGNLVDITGERVSAALVAIEKSTNGKTIEFPGQVRISVVSNHAIVSSGIRASQKVRFEHSLRVGEPLLIEETGSVVHVVAMDCSSNLANDSGKWTVFIDAGNLDVDKLTVRNRRQGDRFKPLGMKGTKKLKDFFIDEKIDKTERDSVLLVCEGEKIIWVAGYRISDGYKTNPDTENVLKLTVLPTCYEK